MKNPIQSERATSLGLLLGRLPMGAFFLMAGITKLRMGVPEFVTKYCPNIPPQVPQAWGEAYMHAIPYMEVVVGAMLILGLFGRLAGLVGALLVITFTVGLTGIQQSGVPFHPNLIYIGLLLMILLTGAGRISLDGLMFRRRPASAP
jgi:putative oxidoreductase